MLGGSVYIAFIRFAVSLAGVILLFSRMSESRFNKKKTIICYSCFSVLLLILASVWYVVDWESCVRIVAFAMYMCFAVFAIVMSRDSIYLSIYKLALTFYLLAVFLISGLEVAVIFFNRNVWADIITRILLILLMTLFIEKKLKKSIKGFGDYVEKEVDKFSVAVMIICILLGIGFILNPNIKERTPYRIYQLIVNFVLTGTLQLLVYRFYLHIGIEKEYERENQLIQMNHRLLERQLEIMEESVESGKRLRHDIRHHNAVIAEYARRGQREELLQYLEEYEKETNRGTVETICANTAVNNILSAYTRKARNEQIKVKLDVEIGKDLAIPNIDLVAILANAYENAIYACMEVKKYSDERECAIHLMVKKRKNKLIIFCSNTCRLETEIKDGQPKTEFTGGIGVSSIIKTAEKYSGEYDFKNDNGVFIFRLIMNIPSDL
ncbi:MAG: GHKL domain-containing protein [Roseburia sp.]|nr:GHKL domain-containing protein [Ruminococcus sp.]MCM1154857.1 GHKL domain-containing protein [Roseburia sp.]MCM1242460.1 GHKL domain-containing protein [Roseburia sp.]